MSGPQAFRRKTEIVSALRLTRENAADITEWFGDADARVYISAHGVSAWMTTPQGRVMADEGSWIVYGADGFHPETSKDFFGRYVEVVPPEASLAARIRAVLEEHCEMWRFTHRTDGMHCSCGVYLARHNNDLLQVNWCEHAAEMVAKMLAEHGLPWAARAREAQRAGKFGPNAQGVEDFIDSLGDVPQAFWEVARKEAGRKSGRYWAARSASAVEALWELGLRAKAEELDAALFEAVGLERAALARDAAYAIMLGGSLDESCYGTLIRPLVASGAAIPSWKDLRKAVAS